MFSRIKYEFLCKKRARLNYFLNIIATNILSGIVINIVTSVYINIFPNTKIKQPVSFLPDFGFSVSFYYGFIYSTILITTYGMLIAFDIQRLRDMGYRHPMCVSLLLLVLKVFSAMLAIILSINFVTLFIETGLFIFFIIMIFSASKSSSCQGK